MTILVIILLALWLGLPLPKSLQGTRAEATAQEMQRYLPPPPAYRRAPTDTEAGS